MLGCQLGLCVGHIGLYVTASQTSAFQDLSIRARLRPPPTVHVRAAFADLTRTLTLATSNFKVVCLYKMYIYILILVGS